MTNTGAGNELNSRERKTLDMRIVIVWFLAALMTLVMRWLRCRIQTRKGIVPFTAPRRVLVTSYVVWAGLLAPVGLVVATAGVLYWQFMVKPPSS